MAPPRGWTSPDTMLWKTNVFLTSLGEQPGCCDLRPVLLLGLGFPAGTDCGHLAKYLSPRPSPGACGRLWPLCPHAPPDWGPRPSPVCPSPPSSARCSSASLEPSVERTKEQGRVTDGLGGEQPPAPGARGWGDGGACAHQKVWAPQAPAAAARPSPTSGPPNVCHGGGHLLVPRLAAALSPGGFPTAALGRKGPSLTGGEVTLPCWAHTKALPPQAPPGPPGPPGPAGSCLFVLSSQPRRDPRGPSSALEEAWGAAGGSRSSPLHCLSSR